MPSVQDAILRATMKVEDFMWWNYPPKVLDHARRMKDGRYSWREIAAYLYRIGFPFYEPEMLRLAVLAADRGEDRPPERLVEQRRESAPPLPPRPHPRSSIPASPAANPKQLAESYRVAWSERFPDKPWPGDKIAIRALMRAERRRPIT